MSRPVTEKIAFNIVKGCKSKDHPDGNAGIALDKLKNKYEPMSAPSMVKLDNQFRDSALKKGEDPKVWITQLKDICVRLKDMGSGISERQFMIHVLNNLTSDYDLQVALLERRIGDVEQPLTVSEIRAELSLRFEWINNNSNKDVASQDMSSKTVSNSRKGTHDSTITTLTPVTVILVIVIEKTSSHKTWFSRRHRMQRILRMTFGFVIAVQVHTIVLQIKACLMLKTSMRTFVLEMGIP
jgi:gag-polypeptide of LTR copia-type